MLGEWGRWVGNAGLDPLESGGLELGHVLVDGGAADAAGLGGGQALVGAFDDEFADELGEGGEHVEDQAAARRGGVEGLFQGSEPDAAAAQVGDDRDEVLQGAGEPVQRGMTRVSPGRR